MIVISDTSPLNYLILIQYVDVLGTIYGHVVIPPAVQDEMLSPKAPAPIQLWISNPPHWLEVRTPSRLYTPLDSELGAGEIEAIAIALGCSTETLLLIDEKRARREAEALGLKVAGTLAVLLRAHQLGLLDIREAIERLEATNFKGSEALFKSFLDRA